MRDYDALLLDLDGTLVTPSGTILPRTRNALVRAVEAGVIVMIATGRSELGTLPVLDELGFEFPAIVYNGAGVYCPKKRRLIEERILSNTAVAETLAFARARRLLPVVMRPGEKFAPEPENDEERGALRWLEGLSLRPFDDLPRESLLRITLFGANGRTSAQLAAEFEQAVDLPLYTTHFPLSWLPDHAESTLSVLDVQPPCRGKGEALRLLEEEFGIPPARVVAVGDADNDLPMVTRAGLGVAMQGSMAALLAVAKRVIGPCDSESLAELVEELFLR